MKNEYDFSRAQRGKFYRPEATLKVPVYLSAEVQELATEEARVRGIDVEELVNEVLRKYSAAGGFSGS